MLWWVTEQTLHYLKIKLDLFAIKKKNHLTVYFDYQNRNSLYKYLHHYKIARLSRICISIYFEEAAWPSGLGRWCCNLKVPGQGLHPATSGICFLVVLSSNLQSCFVKFNSQLVHLLPVGIFNYITFI